MKKVLAIFTVALLFAPFFALAAGNTATSTKQNYYLITVTWDSESNSLSPSGNITLTDQNLLKDTGAGSQFYARVINFSNKPEPFQPGNYKIYLGQWKLNGSAKKGEIKVTVPYFADGSKVALIDSQSKKIVLVGDVSKLAKVKTSAAANAGKTVAASQNVPAASAVTYLIGGHSAAYWWTMRILILAILIGGGYFIWRWRKKKKAGLNTSQLSRTEVKK